MKPNGQGYGQHPNGQPTSSSYQKQQPPQPTYGNNNAHQANAPHHTAAHHMPYSQTSNAPGILPVPPQSQAHFPHHSAANNHYPNTSTTHASQAAPQSFQQTNGKSAAIIPPQPYAAPASVNTPYEQNPQVSLLAMLPSTSSCAKTIVVINIVICRQ